MLRLYREILKAGSRYPSKNRGAVLGEIKAEFRAGKDARDRSDIEQRLNVAKQSLAQMQQFSGLGKDQNEYEVYLDGGLGRPTTN